MSALFLWRMAVGVLLFVTLALGLLLAVFSQRREMVEARIRLVQGREEQQKAVKRVSRAEDILRGVRRLGSAIIQSGVLSRKAIADLEQTLAAAGYRPASALPLVVGGKVALMIGLPLVAWLAVGSLEIAHGAERMIVAVAGAAVGMILPDMIIGRLRKRYLADVERGLPDALDLLVICADAGLPLETALDRVALEFRDSDAPTANELALTAGEMKVMPDRRQALGNLGVRTGLDSLTALGGTLAQTLQYGTPLTQALRVLSAEMRHIMLTRFEERAARLPVMLTMPMMLFFLPCVILVVGGPAAVQVYHMMKG
jgi:tight adherence protein C